MAEANSYQMAIDLLRCHLGLSEEEAMKELGLDTLGSEQEFQERPQAEFPH